MRTISARLHQAAVKVDEEAGEIHSYFQTPLGNEILFFLANNKDHQMRG